ncbi:Ig-like domain-containing protein, partial [Flavobacterium granuli]
MLNFTLSRKNIFLILFLIFATHAVNAQFYEKHYIAPAPWQYFSNANEIVVSTESIAAVNFTITKSDGTPVSLTTTTGVAVTSLTTKAGSPAVYRFVGNPTSLAMHTLSTVINAGGIIVSGDKPISVNLRNIASDQISGGDSYIKGNAALSSFGNPGVGVSFRVGYYRNDSTGNGTPIYSAMALYNNTVLSVNGSVVATLQAGQSWLFKATMGSLVTSSRSIVMNTGAAIDAPVACGDGTFDQIPPISVLGKEYIVVKGNGNDTAEQTTVVATVANTSVTVTTYNSAGSFVEATTKVLTNAGDFYTFINGVAGNNKYSSSRIVATENVVVYSGTADGCEVDISTVAPAQACSGSLVVETSQFLAYNKSPLDYFGYILLKSATDKVYLSGVDITGYSGVAKRQLGTTGWYLITFTKANINSPAVINISSTSRLTVSLVEQGGGFSMSGFFSKFVDLPSDPNLTYVAGGSCSAQTAVLTVSSGIAPYQWYLNGAPITGATSASYTATTSGAYSVSSTTSCGPALVSNPISVALCTDLSIAKTVDNERPIFDANVTFTITAKNEGPSSATGVLVNDILPSGYTFVSATPSLGTYANGTGVWSIGNLANGATATLDVKAKVLKTGAYTNTATISSDETDPVPGNNSASITPTPISCDSAPLTTGVAICPGESGSLTATTSATTSVTTLSGAWTTSSPSANRPKDNISTKGCGFSGNGNSSKYIAISFEVSISGSYIFEMNRNDSYNGMGYIVSGAFVPGDCDRGGTWLAGDDNSGSDNEPKITVTLAAGSTYTLISTTKDNETGAFNWTITPPSGGGIIPAINWYTTASGGSPIGSGSSFNPVVAPGSGLSNTDTPGTYIFYAATTDIPDCRTATAFVIKSNAVAPTGITGTTTICPGDFTTLSLVGGSAGTGAIAEWFSGSCGGTAVGTGNSIRVSPAVSTTYYVRYKGECNTTACVSALVTVNTTAPPTANAQSFCSVDNKKISDLVATGTAVKWYNAATAGTQYTGTEVLATGTYYASQTTNGCESARTAVVVTVNPNPTANAGTALTAICQDDMSAAMGGSVGGGATGGTWTGGTGTWTNANDPSTATYTAGAGESGSITLTLTTTGGSCGTVTATKTITVNVKPTLTITNPAAVCSPSTVDLTAAAITAGSTSGLTYTYFTDATATTVYASPAAATTGTYYIKGTTAAGCFDVKSVVVTVNATPAAPIASAQTFCSEDLKSVNDLVPTGTNIKWYNVNTGGAALAKTTLIGSGTYYASQTVNGCESARTAVTVTVNPASVGGSLVGNATVCSGTNSSTLTLSGHTGSVVRWESSLDNFATAGTPIANTTTSLTVTNLTATTSYRAVVQSGSCSSVNSASVLVTVTPVSVAGTVSSAQTICSGTSPANLTLAGNIGTIQWQSSTDNVTFSDISGATASPLTSAQMGTLTANRYYRAVVQNGVCPAVNSTSVLVTVTPVSVAGTVSSAQTICSGTSPANLTLAGNTGTIQWQSSTDNVTFSDIIGATASPLTGAQMGVLTANRYYRAVVQNGVCTAVNSASVLVTVTPVSVAGTVSSAQTICSGTSPANLTLSGNTGTIQWQSSTDNVTFSDISGATASPLTSAQMGTLTVNRYYRAVVQNGVCPAVNSASVLVTVTPVSVAGTVSSAQTICSGTSPANLTLSGNTGTIQWQSSTDNVTFSDIIGATASPLTGVQMGTLTANRYYRAVVQNGVCPAVNSASVLVAVGDTTAPVADAASLATVTGQCSVASITAPTATDNCSGSITGTTSTAFPITAQGNTTVTWTFTDAAGNKSTQTQNVVVKDVTAPVTPTLADVTGECTATATAPTTTDNCSGTITGTTTDA